MNKTSEILNKLSEAINENARPEKAEGMAKYMRNKFPFAGIQKPGRTELSKPFFKELLSADDLDIHKLIHALWDKEERDYQYFCMDFLRKAEKLWTKDIIKDFEWMITHKPWWDTVDLIASGLVGKYFQKWPEMMPGYIAKWNAADDIWLNRTAIIFQLKYKEKTDTKLLFELIENHKHSGEFFIQKAIGWALRQYARTDAKTVTGFVKKSGLKPLSKREALKHIKEA